MRAERFPRHVSSGGTPPPVKPTARRVRRIPALKLGWVRIRLRSRGDGFSWDVREWWLFWGLVQVARYPGPRWTSGYATWCGGRWLLLTRRLLPGVL